MSGFVGRTLAEAAHPICQGLDPEQRGLTQVEIDAALMSAGIEIGGKVRSQVLRSALDTSQNLYEQAPGSRWRWIERVQSEGPGLSGRALAEEAYRLATLQDPDRDGIDYKTILRQLEEEGVVIKGGNAGQTLFRAMNGAKEWFEWIGTATFRWKVK